MAGLSRGLAAIAPPPPSPSHLAIMLNRMLNTVTSSHATNRDVWRAGQAAAAECHGVRARTPGAHRPPAPARPPARPV